MILFPPQSLESLISITPAEVRHAPEMHAIEADSFAAAWSETSIKYEILQKNSVCLVATGENGAVIGHAYMRHIINEGHINNIAVQKSFRRRGIASLLVNGLINAAEKLEMMGLTLEVRESNTAAISLYQKFGFAPEGVRKDYYSHPRENGIVMWLYLKK
ncbi:MAG: ribosomal protein S18-alanine N-acetyltransferase [Defluviitaleaceae bacterium]|nr:ribosomal protein S18-alanine N-acetyltransferase [Defluviitaleaceae bacterium]